MRGPLSSLLVVLAVFLALHARAQAASDEDEARARSLFDEGVSAVQSGELARASELFRKSSEVVTASVTLLNLALVEARLDRMPSALEALDELEGLANETSDLALADKAARLRAELTPKVAKVSVRLAPADAHLSIDGKPRAARSHHWLSAGVHVLEANKDGFDTRSASLVLRAGERRALSLELTQRPLAEGALPAVARSTEHREPSADPLPTARFDDSSSPTARRDAPPKRLRRVWWISAAALAVAAGALTTVLVVTRSRDATMPVPLGEVGHL